MRHAWLRLGIVSTMVLGAATWGCSHEDDFVAQDPAEGPGEFVGHSKTLNTVFSGGSSPDVQPRPIKGEADWETCNGECQSYCDSQPFDNPIDEAMCPHLWGVGLDTRPVDPEQACRRLFADLRGSFPTYDEIAQNCLGRPIANVAEALIESDAFVFQNQRRWADVLRYNNVAVNFERIYDADLIVGKVYSGHLRFDEFVQVMSAHPVLVRRFDNASDRVEALFNVFVGRPPYDNERADMAKMYALWENDYVDHDELGMRLPDAFIRHRCVGEDGLVDEDTAGACTSVLWGFNRVVLSPDHRVNREGLTWSETLSEEEWELLQSPGRILSTWPVVWEHAVEEVLKLYLGYDIAKHVPLVIEKLVDYVLRQGGDIRAAHFAVVTSQLYLQSSECPGDDCSLKGEHPVWTYGPLRQADAEMWIDSVAAAVSAGSGSCDHRLTVPNQILEESSIGYEVIGASRWKLNTDDRVRVDERYKNLAQTLGGCPDNEVSGRFKAIGILSTATQESFVSDLCNPAMEQGHGVPTSVLLPGGMSENGALSAEGAAEMVRHQVGQFFSRLPVEEEIQMAQAGAEACSPKPCDNETFGRALCYALLSSSEMLFY